MWYGSFSFSDTDIDIVFNDDGYSLIDGPETTEITINYTETIQSL